MLGSLSESGSEHIAVTEVTLEAVAMQFFSALIGSKMKHSCPYIYSISSTARAEGYGTVDCKVKHMAGDPGNTTSCFLLSVLVHCARCVCVCAHAP